jgi:hypothetical protein
MHAGQVATLYPFNNLQPLEPFHRAKVQVPPGTSVMVRKTIFRVIMQAARFK